MKYDLSGKRVVITGTVIPVDGALVSEINQANSTKNPLVVPDPDPGSIETKL